MMIFALWLKRVLSFLIVFGVFQETWSSDKDFGRSFFGDNAIIHLAIYSPLVDVTK